MSHELLHLGMRKPNGLTAIFEAMKGLEKTHLEAMKVYDPNGGQDNLRRMTGRHETSQADKLSWGVANRACSIRISRQVADEAKLTATFFDSDGDGVGDFAGISQKIDSLRKIGVTTVYPTPVIKIQKDDYFNSYDVVVHLSVDDRFGTEERFKELIDTIHNRAMYFVMDLPVSTVDLSHPWLEKHNESKFVVAKPTDPGFNETNFYPFHGANNLKYLGYPSSQNPVLNNEILELFFQFKNTSPVFTQ